MKSFLKGGLLLAVFATGLLATPRAAEAQLAFNVSVPIAQPVYYYDPYYPAAYATYFSYYYPTYNWLGTPYYALFSNSAIAAATVTSPAYYGYPYSFGYPYSYGAYGTYGYPYAAVGYPYAYGFPYAYGIPAVYPGTSTYYAGGYPTYTAAAYYGYAPANTYYAGYYPTSYYGNYYPAHVHATYYGTGMWGTW